MSNSLAIAAVTATLRNQLFRGVNGLLPGTEVTTRPPDKARVAAAAGSQLNLFLYHTAIDGALRNTDMSPQVKPGETGFPPLPLMLFYLVSAYGESDNDVTAHQLLGRAMSVLHDHPLLGSEEIRVALPGNDLYEQVERVRVTPQPLTLEEMSRLWTTFQTQYRISAAYEVSVVLIESTLPIRSPLPVLTRGADDRGPVAAGDAGLPFPRLDAVTPPHNQPSALLGDELVLTGEHLGGGGVAVRLSTARLADPVVVPPPPIVASTDNEIRIVLPDDPTRIVAGPWAVAVVITPSGAGERTTNEVPLMVAPRIVTALPLTVTRDLSGNVTLDIECSPQVLPEQRVSLLLGDLQVASSPRPAPTTTLTFPVTAARAGTFLVRLRVDGSETLLVDRSVTPPTFRTGQRVTIQ